MHKLFSQTIGREWQKGWVENLDRQQDFQSDFILIRNPFHSILFDVSLVLSFDFSVIVETGLDWRQ